MKPIQYYDYIIWKDPPPVPTRKWDWQFVHKDYDGPGDRRCGFAQSLDACMKEIDLIIEEENADDSAPPISD